MLKWQQVSGCPAQLMDQDISGGADAGTFHEATKSCERLSVFGFCV